MYLPWTSYLVALIIALLCFIRRIDAYPVATEMTSTSKAVASGEKSTKLELSPTIKTVAEVSTLTIAGVKT